MRSVPVLAASDRAAGGAQDPEHSANHHQDDADRPQNGNRDDKTHDQQHDAKNDHFGSYSEVGATRTGRPGAGSAGGESLGVYLAVESHARETTEQGTDQRGQDGGGDRYETDRGDIALIDRDARQVQLRVHVVLRARNRRQRGEDDGDDHPPQPYRQALPDSVEAGHPTGDVAAAEIRDEQDDQQSDGPDQADGPRGAGGVRGFLHGLVDVLRGSQPERHPRGRE